jgi:PGDYG protein
VWAKPMTDAFDVTLDRDRGTLRGRAGDWLVQYAPSDFSVVGAQVFAQTYELLD